jgi:hypothetical protein
MPTPWPIVWIIVGWLVALLTLRMGIRTHEDLTRRIVAERVVEREEAQAERDVARRDEAEREKGESHADTRTGTRVGE